MSDMDAIVAGAVVLGFEKQPDGKYICTRDQLITLCAIVAQETVKQVRGESDEEFVSRE